MSSPQRYSRVTVEIREGIKKSRDAYFSRIDRGETPSLEETILLAPAEHRLPLLQQLLPTEMEHLENKKKLPTCIKLCEWYPRIAEEIRIIYQELPQDLQYPDNICHYRLLSLLDRGGQARVVVAKNEQTEELVALKFVTELHSQLRLKREAEILEQLDHRQVCQYVDYGQHGQFTYLVMELVKGDNLRRNCIDYRPSPLVAARWVRQVAKGITYLHHEGVVHRDIKPDNIALDLNSRTKILDLGLAIKLQQKGFAEPPLQDQGGTHSYMAPEHLLDIKKVKHELSDVYALGALLYFLLKGHDPSPSLSHDCIRNFRNSESDIDMVALEPDWQPNLSVLADCPHTLRDICIKAMHFEPGRRYHSAKALTRALTWFVSKSIARSVAPYVLTILFGIVILAKFTGALETDSSARSQRSAATPPSASSSPSWLEELAQNNNFSLDSINQNSFEISVERILSPHTSLPKKNHRLWVRADEVHPDLLGAVEFRIGKGAWRGMYVNMETKDGRHWAWLLEADTQSHGPIELQLDTKRGVETGHTVGPFLYEIDIATTLAKANVDRFTTALQDEWLTWTDKGWAFSEDFTKIHVSAIKEIRVGPTETELETILLLRDGNYYGKDPTPIPRELAIYSLNSSFRNHARKEDRQLTVYVQILGIDGRKSEIRRHVSQKLPEGRRKDKAQQPRPIDFSLPSHSF